MKGKISMNLKELKNEIFNTLGVKPNETFMLNPGPLGKYYLNEDLTLYHYNTNNKLWEIPNTLNISHLICGNISIETKRNFTEDEITILKYYKNILKCDYIARDKDDGLFGYVYLPYKGETAWHSGEDDYYELPTPTSAWTYFPWITWDDEKPFKIPSFSEDNPSLVEEIKNEKTKVSYIPT